MSEEKNVIDKLHQSIKDLQETHTSELEKGRAEYGDIKGKIEAMTEDVTKLMEEKQEQDKRIKYLESLELKGVDTNDFDDKQKEVRKHFVDFLRHKTSTPVNFDDYLAEKMDVKALSISSDPDGGFTVMPEFMGIMEKRMFETSDFRPLAMVHGTTNDAVEFVVDNDEADFEWVGETQSRDDVGARTPTLDLKRIDVYELSAEPQITARLLDDAGFNVEMWLNMKVADRFARAENDAFINGNGVAKPRGILTYPNWTGTDYQVNAIQQINSGRNGYLTRISSTVDADALNGSADALIDLQNSLFSRYQANAKWIMSRETFGAVALLKDADGNYIFNRNLDMNTGQSFSILGKPIHFMNDMPNAGRTTAGDNRCFSCRLW